MKISNLFAETDGFQICDWDRGLSNPSMVVCRLRYMIPGIPNVCEVVMVEDVIRINTSNGRRVKEAVKTDAHVKLTEVYGR